MTTASSTHRSTRPSQQWFGIVLLMLALVSSPFQYALASCCCEGGKCCSQAESIDCCGTSTQCCCSGSQSDNLEVCSSGCSSCGSHCQCGSLEVTPSQNQIGQTETVGPALLPSTLASSIVDHRQPIVEASQASFPDLVSLRLHAFLCVWLN